MVFERMVLDSANGFFGWLGYLIVAQNYVPGAET